MVLFIFLFGIAYSTPMYKIDLIEGKNYYGKIDLNKLEEKYKEKEEEKREEKEVTIIVEVPNPCYKAMLEKFYESDKAYVYIKVNNIRGFCLQVIKEEKIEIETTKDRIAIYINGRLVYDGNVQEKIKVRYPVSNIKPRPIPIKKTITLKGYLSNPCVNVNVDVKDLGSKTMIFIEGKQRFGFCASVIKEWKYITKVSKQKTLEVYVNGEKRYSGLPKDEINVGLIRGKSLLETFRESMKRLMSGILDRIFENLYAHVG